MKKTTYIMLGALIGGFIALLSLSRWYLNEADKIPYDYTSESIEMYTIGGEVTKVPLDMFDAIRFTEKTHGIVKIANYKGVAVCESDTATRPWLMARALWIPLLNTSVTDGALDVCINRDVIAELYGTRVRTEDFVLATVIVPRGTVDNIAVKDHTLYLDSIRADRFTTAAPDRLVLNVCTIDTLKNSAGSIDELKLDASAVGNAQLRGVSKKFTVTCTTPESMITTLSIDGVSSGKTARLRLNNANIGTLIWNPDDLITDVTLETAAPINYIRKK